MVFHIHTPSSVPLYILSTHVNPCHTVYLVYPCIIPVYPCLTLSYCIPCIPLYILCTRVYPSHTAYPALCILCAHVYPSHNVYPEYHCISCLPMFTLVILYTLKPIMQRNYEIGKMDRSRIDLWSTISDPHPSSQYFTVNHRKN